MNLSSLAAEIKTEMRGQKKVHKKMEAMVGGDKIMKQRDFFFLT